MHSSNHLFAPSKNIDSIIAGAIGFLIILFFSRHSGIGVSPDSVTYISAARNFNSGKGLIGFDNMPLVDFPALYSVFLATVSLVTRMDPLQYGAVMNGALFAFLLYLSGSVMNGFTFPSRWYKRILLSCFVLSPSLLEIYSMLWSETIFILLTILFFIAIKNYFRTHHIRTLLAASFVVALACVSRYAGVVLIGAGGILLILDSYPSIRQRMIRVFIFSASAGSLLILNIIRNRMASGYSTGIRQKGITSLLQNIYYFGKVLCDWLPIPATHAVAFIATIASIVIGLAVLAILLRKRATAYSYENIAAVFCLLYIVFMLLSATVSRYEQFTNRLLSPIFIPLLWTLSYSLQAKAASMRSRTRIIAAGLGILVAAGFQYNQLAADYETWDGVKDAGIPGYTEDPFTQSDLVIYLEKNKAMFKPGYAIYSNAGDAVYFFTGHSAQLLPQLVFPKDLQLFYMEHRHYLVWFDDVDNPDLIGLQQILQHKKMTLIRQLSDGAIYVYE